SERPNGSYLMTMKIQQTPLTTTNISEHEFSCHCCYDILVNPTTLTCGHNFCRHCLALWWESSHKNECPECREKWEGFPKVNILLRLLLMLGEEELLKPPYQHRKPGSPKTLGIKPPQNLWEYKAANAGKALFLLYALKRSPRLTLFYLYLFDYSETFLPFLHTCCPAITHIDQSKEDLGTSVLLKSLEPSWRQWAEFLVKYSLLPYQLIAEFAWDWLSVHYWTSRFIIVNAMLLSVLEGCALWRLWTRDTATKDTEPLWKMLSQGFAFALLWPFIPQFVCNCLFYWALYFSPIINIDLVVQQLMHPETQAP
uniref:Bifunctional apoptosis regulator n=1 Tax=Sphaeramia orbicularis TaxID=375764 RepID=A0A672Y7S6_9TELE